MRKILIGVLVGLMLIGSGFFMVNGLAKINIKGAKGIDEKILKSIIKYQNYQVSLV